jgi:hypothetical protein
MSYIRVYDFAGIILYNWDKITGKANAAVYINYIKIIYVGLEIFGNLTDFYMYPAYQSHTLYAFLNILYAP